jgi:hypothetical protein
MSINHTAIISISYTTLHIFTKVHSIVPVHAALFSLPVQFLRLLAIYLPLSSANAEKCQQLFPVRRLVELTYNSFSLLSTHLYLIVTDTTISSWKNSYVIGTISNMLLSFKISFSIDKNSLLPITQLFIAKQLAAQHHKKHQNVSPCVP